MDDCLQMKVGDGMQDNNIFDRFSKVEPIMKDLYLQWIDGVPLKLKAPFDLSFLSGYGRVFKVFDEQRSGNLCFGVQAGDGKRYFVKFAGAPTVHYNGTMKDAVGRLKAATAVYQELSHPNLISYVGSEEIGGGYALAFEWTDAECAGGDYPESRRKFMALPLVTRMKIYEDILSFLEYVSQRSFVAIDFYDGNILYDFEAEKTILCDIDLYQKAPYTGELGRWGSASYVSPEECTPGAVMDKITNVHTMGAAAFALFSNYDRSPEKWPLSRGLYNVVKRAVSDERGDRQQSIRQLIEEWETAK